MASLNISLPDTMRQWIDQQVASGDYANASDYIRDLLRHDQRQREALNIVLLEGEQSGISLRSVQDIITDLKAE
jgi:antitoxin ParD1/3/4